VRRKLGDDPKTPRFIVTVRNVGYMMRKPGTDFCMKVRTSISVKIILLAFLNVLLLGVIVAVFARMEYGVEVESFLLHPRATASFPSRAWSALELPNRPDQPWGTQALEQYSQKLSAKFFLFDRRRAANSAGAPVSPPKRVLDFITPRHFGPPGPQIVVTHVKDPPNVLGGHARPALEGIRRHPIRGNLVWQDPILLDRAFLFRLPPLASWFARRDPGLALLLGSRSSAVLRVPSPTSHARHGQNRRRPFRDRSFHPPQGRASAT